MDQIVSPEADFSYDPSCLIAIAVGVALIAGLSLIAAFCFPEKKK